MSRSSKLALLSCLLGARVFALPLPGPAPQHRAVDAAALNRSCTGCHAAIAAEWRASFHRRAYSDPAFQRVLRSETQPFCRACHAPEAAPRALPQGWAAEAGVACVTCHVRDGQIVSGPPKKEAAAAPHPVVRDVRWTESAVCSRCHQFSFPDGHARVRPELMQSTLHEHAASPLHERSCVTCHMPQTGGPRSHRSHRFAGGHDPQLLRRALEVAARRPTPTLVQLVLRPLGVGHAFPTGDLFRRLEVRVSVRGPDGQRHEAVRQLSRHFAMEQQVPGRFVRVTRSDDRLFAPTVLDFPLPLSAGQPVEWSVTYQRVLMPQPDRDLLDGALVLASGRLQ